MPGKNVGEHAWRYMTNPALYRIVTQTCPDVAGDLDVVNGLVQVIPMDELDAAYENELILGFVPLEGASNIRAEIYADMGASGTDPGTSESIDITDVKERWCLWKVETGISVPEVHVYRDVPPRPIKVLVVGVVAGKVVVTYSHNA